MLTDYLKQHRTSLLETTLFSCTSAEELEYRKGYVNCLDEITSLGDVLEDDNEELQDDYESDY